MTAIILDASALLAMLRDEAGGAKVAGVIAGARIGVVNLAEVVSHFVHVGMPLEAVEAMLAPLPMVVVDADAALAKVAGGLRKVTANVGLSLGDRFCLALALREKAPAWTADRQWRTISGQIDAEIVIIR